MPHHLDLDLRISAGGGGLKFFGGQMSPLTAISSASRCLVSVGGPEVVEMPSCSMPGLPNQPQPSSAKLS